ncbi:MAG: class I SAM-dependent methyltransferase [Bryobacterales bacterium]|nr:class I SAM-dependent methyltransferase [Bryobacterales bacterium]
MNRNTGTATPVHDSAAYWESRYAAGGNSGTGSYSLLAEFKAGILNGFVKTQSIRSVIEFGCGDGNQLTLAEYPAYSGYDVSATTIGNCRRRFAGDTTKRFALVQDYAGETAELALSLDVIYHLLEDDVYERYMKTLFAAASRYVIVYSSNTGDNKGYEGSHVRHRVFTGWIQDNAPNWNLIEHIPNKYPYRGDYHTGSFADFYVFKATA